jgi:hypothetical protein
MLAEAIIAAMDMITTLSLSLSWICAISYTKSSIQKSGDLGLFTKAQDKLGAFWSFFIHLEPMCTAYSHGVMIGRGHVAGPARPFPTWKGPFHFYSFFFFFLKKKKKNKKFKI